MDASALRVPAPVVRRAQATGEAGEAWLAGLGGLVRDLCAAWRLSFDEALTSGTEAFVAAVTTPDGRRAVLKVAPPDGGAFAAEVRTLLAAAGRGYAEVYAQDLPRRAVLMERLGPQLAELGLPVDAQIERICATLAEAWRPVPPGVEVMTGAEKARFLADLIATLWEEMGRPCSERAVALALRFAEIRGSAFDPATAVLCHGDAHAWNTLAVPGKEVFKFVDPDGLFAEPAYDLAIPTREWSSELLAGDPARLARARCRKLADLTGLDAEAVWQWGFVERVSTGLLCAKIELAEGRDMLAVADALAAAPA
jgi:streptomycin 6-kinase